MSQQRGGATLTVTPQQSRCYPTSRLLIAIVAIVQMSFPPPPTLPDFTRPNKGIVLFGAMYQSRDHLHPNCDKIPTNSPTRRAGCWVLTMPYHPKKELLGEATCRDPEMNARHQPSPSARYRCRPTLAVDQITDQRIDQ